MKKLAIIGASYFQNPLILKAKEMGIETHVFAWAADDIGEKTADFFYPISIVDKEAILEKCQEIGVDGITTIASDLATVSVGYVAAHMGLIANSMECIARSTDKALMRKAFEEGGDPSPKSVAVHDVESAMAIDAEYPIIVKPADRSGSRGVTKLDTPSGLEDAVKLALDASFSKTAVVEEFAQGSEFSVEHISWQGEHRFLAITEKFTTNAPHFIEMGHLEPARIDRTTQERVRKVVGHALTTLGVEYGASHAEVKVDGDGTIRIIEIGARMGGDFIGSDLVQLSTGYDFVKAVVDTAIGIEPERPDEDPSIKGFAGVRFVFGPRDADIISDYACEHPKSVVRCEISDSLSEQVTDSSNRLGYCIAVSDSLKETMALLSF